MQSMTGFGSARCESPRGSLQVQLAAVNHRQCRVALRSDLRDLALDEAARNLIQERLRRGSITVQISVVEHAGGGFDQGALREQWVALKDLADELGAPAPRLEALLRQSTRSGADESDCRDALLNALDAACSACVEMRSSEGARLLVEFRRQHEELGTLCRRMAERAAQRQGDYRERLENRLGELLGERVDEATLVRELALFAERSDISEELVRLESHLAQLEHLLVGDGAIGKQLDFLLQEVGREINTSGAKANDAELARLVIDGKTLLEQMREQAANVL